MQVWVLQVCTFSLDSGCSWSGSNHSLCCPILELAGCCVSTTALGPGRLAGMKWPCLPCSPCKEGRSYHFPDISTPIAVCLSCPCHPEAGLPFPEALVTSLTNKMCRKDLSDFWVSAPRELQPCLPLLGLYPASLGSPGRPLEGEWPCTERGPAISKPLDDWV